MQTLLHQEIPLEWQICKVIVQRCDSQISSGESEPQSTTPELEASVSDTPTTTTTVSGEDGRRNLQRKPYHKPTCRRRYPYWQRQSNSLNEVNKQFLRRPRKKRTQHQLNNREWKGNVGHCAPVPAPRLTLHRKNGRHWKIASRSHPCLFCSRIFKSNSELVAHTQTHTHERPHSKRRKHTLSKEIIKSILQKSRKPQPHSFHPELRAPPAIPKLRPCSVILTRCDHKSGDFSSTSPSPKPTHSPFPSTPASPQPPSSLPVPVLDHDLNVLFMGKRETLLLEVDGNPYDPSKKRIVVEIRKELLAHFLF